MKITKLVDDKGFIKIQIEDMPQYPQGTAFEASHFRVHQNDMRNFENWKHLTLITIGDFKMTVIQHVCKDQSAEKIAEVLQETYQRCVKDYQDYVEKNTNSVEVITAEQAIKRLTAENRLCYRDKTGKFQTLNI